VKTAFYHTEYSLKDGTKQYYRIPDISFNGYQERINIVSSVSRNIEYYYTPCPLPPNSFAIVCHQMFST